jgi:ubiquinone/menaquinone biosynthesis C-methylase UbiE
MVAVAARTLASFGARASARQADATALPFADASFDTVVSFLMLHHVIEWERALAEAARVLRPGGLLLGYDLLDGATARLVHRVDRSPFRLAPEDALRTALASWDKAAVLRNGPVARFAGRTVAASVQQ